MAAVGATNQAFSWYGLITACQDFSGPSQQAQCIWGAVSTAILYGGALYGAAQYTGRIQTWMGNNGIQIGNWKREDINALVSDLSQTIGSPVEHLGYFDYATPSPAGTHSRRKESTTLAVFGLTNPHGVPMHFSYLGKTDGIVAFKFGLGNGTVPAATASGSSRVKGRESYNDQYFSGSGIDFTVTENRSEGGELSQSGDWAQMFDEVSCLMRNKMSAAGHWFQVYDNYRQGTIVGGAMAPFAPGSHWSVISAMTSGPWPVGETTSCEIS
ncbi:hypothetical protein VE03_07235 [Pseudogymnoascus sp. 23342-1-I1]|nr:hypothetical protein VE03_07235 [Pseudogymnoascus sp. 23342-1-I1]